MNNHLVEDLDGPWVRQPHGSVLPAVQTMVLDHGGPSHQRGPSEYGGPWRVVTTAILLFLGYYIYNFFDAHSSTRKQLFYRTCIYFIPPRVVHTVQKMSRRSARAALKAKASIFKGARLERQEKDNLIAGKLTEEARRGIVARFFNKVRSLSPVDKVLVSNEGPPGLGNNDYSCYQNSILQSLASLPAFGAYLERSLDLCNRKGKSAETHRVLTDLISNLNDISSTRPYIWTPETLKSMDSMEQQDAQEYFSKVVDAIEQETFAYGRFLKRGNNVGVECLVTDCRDEDPVRSTPTAKPLQDQNDFDEGADHANPVRNVTPVARGRLLESQITPDIIDYTNPIQGTEAQRLECKVCGYSDGLSFSTFNCLTVNMGGLQGSRHIVELLNDYTQPEAVEGVECAKCTHAAAQLPTDTLGMTTQSDVEPTFKKSVLRTKLKQTTIGKLPKDLVIHINRSIFNQYGEQVKNANWVKFPAKLDFLDEWLAPLDGGSGNNTHAYELKCVVTHSGGHDSGQYIAFGKRGKDWYTFDDDIVYLISEEKVLNQGNAFMLFYEASQHSLPTVVPSPPLKLSTILQEPSTVSPADSSSQGSPDLSPAKTPFEEPPLSQIRTTVASTSC